MTKHKYFVSSGLVILVVLLGGWYWSITEKNLKLNSAKLVPGGDIETITEPVSLLVDAQTANNVVRIKSVRLEQPGFLVVRELIDNKAGQIVEISQYLNSGTYTDISIPLGDFYDGHTELMVIIYSDSDNDQVLNDLDQPFVNKNNETFAVSVKTGLKVLEEVLSSDIGFSSAEMISDESKILTVRYTSSGFEPALLEIESGSIVHFVNESDTDMWVASDTHPAHDTLPTFDQFRAGDTFWYTFTEVGRWDYHDHINASLVGSIIVKPKL